MFTTRFVLFSIYSKLGVEWCKHWIWIRRNLKNCCCYPLVFSPRDFWLAMAVHIQYTKWKECLKRSHMAWKAEKEKKALFISLSLTTRMRVQTVKEWALTRAKQTSLLSKSFGNPELTQWPSPVTTTTHVCGVVGFAISSSLGCCCWWNFLGLNRGAAAAWTLPLKCNLWKGKSVFLQPQQQKPSSNFFAHFHFRAE